MQEIKRVPFEHQGKRYEVVVASTGSQLRARAMYNGQPANKTTISADVDTAIYAIAAQAEVEKFSRSPCVILAPDNPRPRIDGVRHRDDEVQANVVRPLGS
jgi:hypothetical protein